MRVERERFRTRRRKGIEEQGGELSFEDLEGVNDAPLRLGALSSALQGTLGDRLILGALHLRIGKFNP